jgi:hypothetical protein
MYGGMDMGMDMGMEAEMAAREEMQDPGRMMEDMYRSMRGGPSGAAPKKKQKVEEDTMEGRRIKGSRRRLKDELVSVLTGLGTDVKRDDGSRAGIHVLVTDAAQEALLNKLTAAITTLLDTLGNKEELDSEKLDDAIAAASDAIGQVLADTSAGAEEPPPAETTTAAAAATAPTAPAAPAAP